MRYLTQRDYAAHKGVSRKTIWKWVRSGKIFLTQDRKIDVKAADKMLAQTHVSSMEGPSVSRKEQLSLTMSRTQREHYAAKLAKLSYEKEREKLIDREQVRADSAQTARAVIKIIMEIPGRLAQPIALEQNQDKVFERLTNEFNRVLNAMTQESTAREDTKERTGE